VRTLTSTTETLRAGDPGYRGLGVIDNPFRITPGLHEGASPGTRLAIHAATDRFISQIDCLAEDPNARPFVVMRTDQFPKYYGVAALSESLQTITSSHDLGMLPVHIGLELLREGRMRGILGAVAEMVCGVGFDLTLAAFVRKVLENPNRELEEFAALEGVDLGALIAQIDADPADFVARFFGAPVMERLEFEQRETKELMAHFREGQFEANPEEADDTVEVRDAAEDPLAETLVMKAEDGEMVIGAATEAETPTGQVLVDYILAFTRTEVSPIVARAIQAYAAQGTFPAATELKMTKAPKKTLVALLAFASVRWRKVLIMFDHFEQWEDIPDDIKASLVGTFTELSFMIGEHALLGFLLSPEVAPEIERQFGGGPVIDWSYAELPEVEAPDAPLGRAIVERWIDDAAIDDRGKQLASSPAVEELLSAFGGQLSSFAAAAQAAFDDAAERGASELDETAVAAGMAAAEQAVEA